MKRLFAVLLTLILCCSPVLGSTVFAGHIWHVAHEGEVEEWNGSFEHETLAFYFCNSDATELGVRGVRKTEYLDGAGNYWWEYVSSPIVIIPDAVQGYPVTYVGWEVLASDGEWDGRDIERIYVGKNVHVLGHNAFAGREVVIGKNDLVKIYGYGSSPDENSQPFTSAKVYCYPDSDAYRIAEESGAWIYLINESHLISDKVKIDEALNVYLPWGVTKETLGDYVSVDGDARINVLGDTIENGTQIELVNSTYGTIDNTYTVVLGKSQITVTAEPQRTAFAKTSFRLESEVSTTGEPCTLTYVSDNPDVAAVDENGVVTTNKPGTAHITVTAADKYGFSETAVCTVTVQYSWWQWLIRIFLFGWLWY